MSARLSSRCISDSRIQDFSAFGNDDSDVLSLFFSPSPFKNCFSLNDQNVLMLLDVSGSGMK